MEGGKMNRKVGKNRRKKKDKANDKKNYKPKRYPKYNAKDQDLLRKYRNKVEK